MSEEMEGRPTQESGGGEQAREDGLRDGVAAQAEKLNAGSAAPAREPDEVRQGEQRPEDPESADDVLTRRVEGSEAADAAVLEESRRLTRRAFAVTGVAAAAGAGLVAWLNVGPREEEQPELLRGVFKAGAALSRGVFRDRGLAPTYPMSRAETLRVNGVFGLKRTMVPESWRLQAVGVRDAAKDARYVQDVTAWEYRYRAEGSGKEEGDGEDPGHDTKVDPKIESSEKMANVGEKGRVEQDENHTGRKPRGVEEAGESDSTLRPGTPGLLLTMADLGGLPRHELVTQFKCIEGWSQVVHWAGFRMADFLELFPPERVRGREPRYVYMETPDGDYYNGYDLEVLRHPQALLVTEMMGAPLTRLHGAPLRLHLPMKYGYKQIKRIGLIQYLDEKPDDYWTRLGYDWYAGL